LDIFDLKVNQRNVFGKGPARDLRQKGLVPAVLYGPKRESLSLIVSPLELKKIYKKSGSDQVILNLIVENGGTQNVTVMIKDVQVSPVTREYLHIDFLEISLDQEIVVSIAVEVTGKSVGAERGGLLNVVRHELEVSCLPMDMPDKIVVDVSELDIGDALHIEDIDVGDKVKLLAEPELTVLTVVPPTVVEEEVPEEELEEEALEEGEEPEGEKAEAPEEASE
jgi:large subunit ribosomal protein L25